MQLIRSVLMIQMNLFTNRYRLTDLDNEFMVASGEGCTKGTIRELGTDMYIFKMDNQ